MGWLTSSSSKRLPRPAAITSEAGKCGGIYISHMRSEGDRLVDTGNRIKVDGGPAGIGTSW